MSRPAVATVVSARPWEGAFVEIAATGARVRLAARIGDPIELAASPGRIGAVVIGAETPWLEPWIFETLRRLGIESIGVHQTGDQVGERLVSQASQVFVETVPPAVLVACAAVLAQAPVSSRSPGTTEPQTQRYTRAAGSTGR